MTFDDVKDMRIGPERVMSAWLGGRKVWERKPEVDTDAIMQSMVCWYDISRQGCTNESMAQNPVLKDLSGNGHDMTCYNFAWGGMSGIGGYNFNDINEISNRFEGTVEGFKYHFTKKLSDVPNFCDIINPNPDKDIVLSVSGLKDGESVVIRQMNLPDSDIVLSNGTHAIQLKDGATSYPFGVNAAIGDIDVIVEFLPDYPGALVSDGVDDYCFVEGLPILTKEKGYTVIAKRKRLAESAGVFISKRTNPDNRSQYGAFLIEKGDKCYSFSDSGDLLDVSENEVIYQTEYSYCGIPLIVRNQNDTDGMLVFAGFTNPVSEFSSYALYSFLLFNRTLTDEEIEWVKTNLIEN